MASTTQSRKARGRILQQWIRDKLLLFSGPTRVTLEPADVTSRSMGAQGTDVLLSPKAKELYPISIEAKNQQAVNVWAGYEQACENCEKGTEPLLIIKRNLHKPLAVIDAEYLIKLHGRLQGGWYAG